MSATLKKSQTFYKKSHLPEISQPPPPPPHRKFLTPPQNFLNSPKRFFQPPPENFSTPPPPKINFSTTSPPPENFSTTPPPENFLNSPENISTLKKYVKNNPPPPPPITFLFLFIFFTSFPSLFKKKIEIFGGLLNLLNPPPLNTPLMLLYFKVHILMIKTVLQNITQV